MLAFMPRPFPLMDSSYMPDSTFESRTTLPLLPSTSMGYYNPSPLAALPVPSSSPKRPKLSLDTSNVSQGFGKKSTSLRLETLSAVSPTVRNTFQNGQLERPGKPTLTPLATNITSPLTTPLSPSQISLPDSANGAEFSASSPTSAISFSTVCSSPSGLPYKLASNATSILSNSPIPRSRNGRLPFSQSRPMFSPPKKVMFKAPLTEEIETTEYTLRHSDIESSSLSSSEPDLSSPRADVSEQSEGDALRNGTREAGATSQSGVKRSSTNIENHSESQAATPVAGRAKRHKWVWTLGPIQSASDRDASNDGSITQCTTA